MNAGVSTYSVCFDFQLNYLSSEYWQIRHLSLNVSLSSHYVCFMHHVVILVGVNNPYSLHFVKFNFSVAIAANHSVTALYYAYVFSNFPSIRFEFNISSTKQFQTVLFWILPALIPLWSEFFPAIFCRWFYFWRKNGIVFSLFVAAKESSSDVHRLILYHVVCFVQWERPLGFLELTTCLRWTNQKARTDHGCKLGKSNKHSLTVQHSRIVLTPKTAIFFTDELSLDLARQLKRNVWNLATASTISWETFDNKPITWTESRVLSARDWAPHPNRVFTENRWSLNLV